MKLQDIVKRLFFVAGCAALVCVANVSDSQAATDSATATGTVIAPITISNTANLSFGTIAPGNGTVVVAPNGTRTPTGVIIPSSSPAATAATFTVTGQDGLGFSITLPESVSMSDGASHTMTADNFISNPSGTGTLTGGSIVLSVGATLNVVSSQEPGTYTGAFDVTVEYN